MAAGKSIVLIMEGLNFFLGLSEPGLWQGSGRHTDYSCSVGAEWELVKKSIGAWRAGSSEEGEGTELCGFSRDIALANRAPRCSFMLSSLPFSFS